MRLLSVSILALVLLVVLAFQDVNGDATQKKGAGDKTIADRHSRLPADGKDRKPGHHPHGDRDGSSSIGRTEGKPSSRDHSSSSGKHKDKSTSPDKKHKDKSSSPDKKHKDKKQHKKKEHQSKKTHHRSS